MRYVTAAAALVIAAVGWGATGIPAAASGAAGTTATVRVAAAFQGRVPAARGAPARAVPRCTSGNLRIRPDGWFVGTGHVVVKVALWNAGPSACNLTGWATVTVLKASRAQYVPKRELNGWGWGGRLKGLPTVVIAAKHEALVVVSGYNFRPPSGSVPCAARYTRLRLIPPGLTQRLEIGLQYLPDCGPLDVSPVLPPADVV